MAPRWTPFANSPNQEVYPVSSSLVQLAAARMFHLVVFDSPSSDSEVAAARASHPQTDCETWPRLIPS